MDPTKLAEMLGQAQQMAQKLQGEMLKKTAEGQAGGGLVRATVDGQGELTRLRIEPAALAGGDASLLEDLVVAAVHDAHTKVRALMQEEMQKLTGGMGLPFPPMR
jgi:DNA-binding YbaB/EbfC family protein